MNNKQYELIGESIWNTYSDMAYIYLGEEKKSFVSRAKEGLAALAGRVTGRRRQRQASRSGSQAGSPQSRFDTTSTIEQQRARKAGTRPTRSHPAPYSGMSIQQLAGRTQADIDNDPYKAPEQKTPR